MPDEVFYEQQQQRINQQRQQALENMNRAAGSVSSKDGSVPKHKKTRRGRRGRSKESKDSNDGMGHDRSGSRDSYQRSLSKDSKSSKGSRSSKVRRQGSS